MRPKVDYRSDSKAAYEDFKKLFPKTETTRQQYSCIIRSFNTAIAEHVLETGSRIRLPFGLGDISITKYKPRKHKTFTDRGSRQVTIINLPIDWQKTRKAGKLIYHLNSHTDGYRFRWKWFSSTALFESARLFSFRPNRSQSRKLALYLKSDPKYAQIYRQWNPT